MISTPDFTFHEFHTVVYQPADRSICKTRGSSVFFCPGDHTFGGIHMEDAALTRVSRQPRGPTSAKPTERAYSTSWMPAPTTESPTPPPRRHSENCPP